MATKVISRIRESASDALVETYYLGRLGRAPPGVADSCLYVDDTTSGSAANEPRLIPRTSLPPRRSGVRRLVVVSDTHARHRELGELPEGDVLIHCGDLLMSRCRVGKVIDGQRVTDVSGRPETTTPEEIIDSFADL